MDSHLNTYQKRSSGFPSLDQSGAVTQGEDNELEGSFSCLRSCPRETAPGSEGVTQHTFGAFFLPSVLFIYYFLFHFNSLQFPHLSSNYCWIFKNTSSNMDYSLVTSHMFNFLHQLHWGGGGGAGANQLTFKSSTPTTNLVEPHLHVFGLWLEAAQEKHANSTKVGRGWYECHTIISVEWVHNSVSFLILMEFIQPLRPVLAKIETLLKSVGVSCRADGISRIKPNDGEMPRLDSVFIAGALGANALSNKPRCKLLLAKFFSENKKQRWKNTKWCVFWAVARKVFGINKKKKWVSISLDEKRETCNLINTKPRRPDAVRTFDWQAFSWKH